MPADTSLFGVDVDRYSGSTKFESCTCTALGKCMAGGLSWGGGGCKIRSQGYLRQSLLAVQVRLTSHTRHGTYNSWVGLRQPEGPDWHRRSTRVAVYIRYSPAQLPARSIDRSQSWRVRALAKWPRCTAKRGYLLNFCRCFCGEILK